MTAQDRRTDDTSRKLLRRTVLKSTAAGAGLAVLGGRAAGQDDEGGDGGTDEGSNVAEVVVGTQVTDGTTVEIESATLPEGGFISLVDPMAAHENLWPRQGETMPRLGEILATQVQGVSEFLEAGTHESVVLEFDEPLEGEKLYQVWLHRNTTDDESFAFVDSLGEEDGRYPAEFEPEDGDEEGDDGEGEESDGDDGDGEDGGDEESDGGDGENGDEGSVEEEKEGDEADAEDEEAAGPGDPEEEEGPAEEAGRFEGSAVPVVMGDVYLHLEEGATTESDQGEE